MKELFDFTIKVNREVDKTETREEDGKTITVTSKVKEDVPVRIIFKQPSRRDIEDADLQFSVEMSNCVKKGILTKGMLVKKYSDTGGMFSDGDNRRLTDLYVEISKLQKDYTSLSLKTNRIEGEEDAILTKIAQARKEAVQIETEYLNLFNHTADVIAQNNIIRWFCLNMTYKQESGGSIAPFFAGNTVQEKMDYMNKLDEDGDEIYEKAYKKLATFVTFWYYSKNANKEDFRQLEKDIEEGKY